MSSMASVTMSKYPDINSEIEGYKKRIKELDLRIEEFGRDPSTTIETWQSVYSAATAMFNEVAIRAEPLKEDLACTNKEFNELYEKRKNGNDDPEIAQKLSNKWEEQRIKYYRWIPFEDIQNDLKIQQWVALLRIKPHSSAEDN